MSSRSRQSAEGHLTSGAFGSGGRFRKFRLKQLAKKLMRQKREFDITQVGKVTSDGKDKG